MKLTDRDVEIMRFINDHGFCTTPHLERKFLIKNWRVYQLIKRLVDAGLVCKKGLFKGKPNIYYLTNEGAAFTGLPALSNVNFGTYEHQITLTSVAIKLGELYPFATWISERKLKYEKFFLGVGVRGHVSDGVLVLNDNQQISIEVELTLKSEHRLERILRSYGSQLTFKEIWYFCLPGVIPTLSKLIAKKPYIKIHALKEFLYDCSK